MFNVFHWLVLALALCVTQVFAASPNALRVALMRALSNESQARSVIRTAIQNPSIRATLSTIIDVGTLSHPLSPERIRLNLLAKTRSAQEVEQEIIAESLGLLKSNSVSAEFNQVKSVSVPAELQKTIKADTIFLNRSNESRFESFDIDLRGTGSGPVLYYRYNLQHQMRVISYETLSQLTITREGPLHVLELKFENAKIDLNELDDFSGAVFSTPIVLKLYFLENPRVNPKSILTAADSQEYGVKHQVTSFLPAWNVNKAASGTFYGVSVR